MMNNRLLTRSPKQTTLTNAEILSAGSAYMTQQFSFIDQKPQKFLLGDQINTGSTFTALGESLKLPVGHEYYISDEKMVKISVKMIKGFVNLILSKEGMVKNYSRRTELASDFEKSLGTGNMFELKHAVTEEGIFEIAKVDYNTIDIVNYIKEDKVDLNNRANLIALCKYLDIHYRLVGESIIDAPTLISEGFIPDTGMKVAIRQASKGGTKFDYRENEIVQVLPFSGLSYAKDYEIFYDPMYIQGAEVCKQANTLLPTFNAEAEKDSTSYLMQVALMRDPLFKSCMGMLVALRNSVYSPTIKALGLHFENMFEGVEENTEEYQALVYSRADAYKLAKATFKSFVLSVMAILKPDLTSSQFSTMVEISNYYANIGEKQSSFPIGNLGYLVEGASLKRLMDEAEMEYYTTPVQAVSGKIAYVSNVLDIYDIEMEEAYGITVRDIQTMDDDEVEALDLSDEESDGITEMLESMSSRKFDIFYNGTSCVEGLTIKESYTGLVEVSVDLFNRNRLSLNTVNSATDYELENIQPTEMISLVLSKDDLVAVDEKEIAKKLVAEIKAIEIGSIRKFMGTTDMKVIEVKRISSVSYAITYEK